HAIYQAMNLAYADRDFYYGDPDFSPSPPIRGLLSKSYAQERLKLLNWSSNNPALGPGDPYSFEGGTNPFHELLKGRAKAGNGTSRTNAQAVPDPPRGTLAALSTRAATSELSGEMDFDSAFRAGTTSIQAADDKGWAISVTPSGGWMPACLAGNT